MAIEASTRRGRLRGSPDRWLPPLVTAVALLACIQLLVTLDVLPEDRIPLPTAVAQSFGEQVVTGKFWASVGASMRGWAFGLALAIAVAIPLGAMAGLSRFVFRSIQFLVDFLRPIPPVALLPLLILVLGISGQVKISLAALGAFFPLFFATLYGVQDIDPVTTDTARVYGLNRRRRLVAVVLPGATPFIATGMRISATIALLLVIGTEMIIGLDGIGRSIIDAQYAGNLESMYARVLAAGLLGVAINMTFRAVERRILRWHPSQQGTAT